MKIHWRRRETQDAAHPLTSGAARAFALGLLLLGGIAACESVASPDLEHARNVAESGAIGGTVRNLDGEPVAGARVQAGGGAEAVTSDAGTFKISGLAPTQRLAVTVQAPGYDATTAIYEVRPGVLLDRPIRIQPVAPPVVIAAGQAATVPFAGGGQVEFPAEAFEGLAPGEPVTVRATYIDTENPAQFSTSPGDFTARTFSGDEVRLESFGMVDVDARDAGGRRLELASGQQATIRFPPRGSGAAPNPGVWSFDPGNGVWVEEGRAVTTPTSIDASVATIGRRKNIDVPFPPVCIEVEVLRIDKVTPRPNQFVGVTGLSYAGFSQGWTNNAGLVQVQVRASSQVLIQSGPAQQTAATPPAGTVGCPRVATLVF